MELSSGKRRAPEPPECLGCPMGSSAALAHCSCGCVRPKCWQQRGGGTRLNSPTQPWGMMWTVQNAVTQWCSPVQGLYPDPMQESVAIHKSIFWRAT